MSKKRKDTSIGYDRGAERRRAMKDGVLDFLRNLIGPAIFIIVVGIAAVVVVKYTAKPAPDEVIEARNNAENPTEPIVLENGTLRLTMDPANTQFEIETANGMVWKSTPEGAANDPVAQSNYKDRLQSTLYLTYSTENGVDTLFDSKTYCTDEGIFEIEQTGPDSLTLHYTIGKMEKVFIEPGVILEADFNALTDNLDTSTAKVVRDYYKKLDINNLKKADLKKKDDYLARYPIFETEVIYVQRDSLNDGIKKKIEGYMVEAGYTYEQLMKDNEMDMEESVSDKPIFNLDVEYKLDGDDLLVSIPFDKMEYRSKYPIYGITVLPNFGAGTKDEDGYLLLPEGGGAQIMFNNGKTSQRPYYSNMYGWDEAQYRDAIVHDNSVRFNTFGIAKGGNSFLCMLEEGAPYAAVQAEVSGMSTSYNIANATYTMLKRDRYEVGVRNNAEVYVYEDELPQDESIIQRYRFLNTDDYVEMAHAYGDYLDERSGGRFGEDVTYASTGTPVTLEIIGAIDDKRQVMGVPTYVPVKLTTYDEADSIVHDLSEGMPDCNLSVKLTGWSNGGVRQKIYKSIKPVKDLGSKKDLDALVQDVQSVGADLYLNGITQRAWDSNIFDGFFTFRDATRFVSKKLAAVYPVNTVTFNMRTSRKPSYVLKNAQALEMADNFMQYAKDAGADVSFDDRGRTLSADYYRKNPISRQQAMENEVAQLQEAADAGTNIMINAGNDYAVPYATVVTNMDLSGSHYTVVDNEIPFYQIALHGRVNYTGESINQAQNATDELLKSAEYGAGLSFTVMAEDSFALQDTEYSKYFGASLTDELRQEIIDTYKRYNDSFKGTFTERITGHRYITQSLTETEYADGTKVYVNYGYEDAEADGMLVPARDYEVAR